MLIAPDRKSLLLHLEACDFCPPRAAACASVGMFVNTDRAGGGAALPAPGTAPPTALSSRSAPWPGKSAAPCCPSLSALVEEDKDTRRGTGPFQAPHLWSDPARRRSSSAGVTQPAGAGLGVKPQGLPPSAPLGSQPCPARSEVRTRRARWPRRLTPAETRFWLGVCHGKSFGCSSEAPEHSQPQRSACRKQGFREDAQEKPLCSRVELGGGKWLREPVRRGGRAQAGDAAPRAVAGEAPGKRSAAVIAERVNASPSPSETALCEQVSKMALPLPLL